MTDYKVNFDVGYFGTDNPATPSPSACRSSCRPTARTSTSTSASSRAQHGSHVAGIAAGNRLFGGHMSGAAPGAKIVSVAGVPVRRRLHGHALFEGMIYVAKQKNVDVINMSIGGLPALNDGNNARASSTTA